MRRPLSKLVTSLAVASAALAVGCGGSSKPAQQPPPQQPYYPQQQAYGPQQQYPQQQYPQQQFPQQQQQRPQQFPQQQQAQAPQQQQQQQNGPFGLPFPLPFPVPNVTGVPGMNAPLVGTEMQKQEVASILQELITNLPADRQGKVRGIPLAFDPNPLEINAFAGCDDRGQPFMAGTVGILDAVDAVAQTKATDELFGTQTYQTYLRAVLPKLQSQNGGSAALPPGIIPPQQLVDPRRLSRARDLFDEMIAFAFGHELAHHYMGHTGCAKGQQLGGSAPDGTAVARIASRIVPLFNQPLEAQADTEGMIDVLNTGKARRARNATKWNEEGGLMLLDFFGNLDGIPLFHPVGLLLTHPNPRGRMIWIQGVARTWALQNPG